MPKIVCSLFTLHNFNRYANSHSLYRPQGAVVFLALFEERQNHQQHYSSILNPFEAFWYLGTGIRHLHSALRIKKRWGQEHLLQWYCLFGTDESVPYGCVFYSIGKLKQCECNLFCNRSTSAALKSVPCAKY